MEAITWALFGASVLGVIFSFIVLYLVTDEETEPPVVYIYTLSFFAVGFVFIMSKELFSNVASIWIWKIGNALSLLNLVICFSIFYKRRNIHWLITGVISLLLFAIPFLINVKIYSSAELIPILNSFQNTYPEIFLSLWLPLFLITVAGITVYSLINRPAKIEQSKTLVNVIERTRREKDFLEFEEREKTKSRSFEEKYFKNLYEEFQHQLNRNIRRSEELYARQRDMIESAVNKITIESRTPSITSTDNHQLIGIVQSLTELKSKLDELKKDSSSESVHLYANSINQNFIRELFHFLITPLSQIESKTIIAAQTPNFYLDNPLNFNKLISTLKISVEICKSVLSAYRELAFVTSSSDWSPESLNQSVLAAGNLYKESIEKEITITTTLNDNYPPYSNNYLLAIILPLLENAIKASPSQKVITVAQEVDENNLKISIVNEAINMPTVKQLQTPGFSSKRDHKGTGLLIARHLIEDQNKGTLTFDIKDNNLITTISIPKRETK